MIHVMFSQWQAHVTLIWTPSNKKLLINQTTGMIWVVIGLCNLGTTDCKFKRHVRQREFGNPQFMTCNWVFKNVLQNPFERSPLLIQFSSVQCHCEPAISQGDLRCVTCVRPWQLGSSRAWRRKPRPPARSLSPPRRPRRTNERCASPPRPASPAATRTTATPSRLLPSSIRAG